MDELFVVVFAFVGGTLRFGIDQLFPNSIFPWPTFCINLVGCFLLAFINSEWLAGKLPARLTLGLGTGVVGAFTTFSTFSLEIIKLFIQHDYLIGVSYAVLSLTFGLLGAFLGNQLGRRRGERLP